MTLASQFFILVATISNLDSQFIFYKCDIQGLQNPSNKSEIAKKVNLFNETLEYIHIAQYQRFYTLTWYDDLTYTQNNDNFGVTKALPQLCYNGPSCQSEKSEFMKQDFIIDTSTPKFTKNDW